MSDLTTIDLSIDRWRLGEARLVKIAWGPSWFWPLSLCRQRTVDSGLGGFAVP